ncbi:flavin reductase family protein [Patiriisocius marinus]|uniref:Flavin oxidoreductase n=1 Tax=Patiriisocius marinus TaxID=1397112 RepID=A0A5J4IWX7_9FLAO|nr:flavin reductase [Patiriisocius marinus]GER58058.1 flavin oxidoreductase [Patiriisocius marinus]
MELNKEAIEQLDRVTRLKIINSVSGIKPANLIGTVSEDGITNVAIFSSVVHLGSNPPLIGFMMRPKGNVPRNTYQNIIDKGFYTINHIHPEFVERAHYTSAKFDALVSEFERCNLTEEYVDGFKAPFVKESTFKIGLKFQQEIKIDINNTSLIIGEIEHLIIPDNVFGKNSNIDLTSSNTVGISGLNSYYSLNKIAEHPYARVKETPEF